MSVALAGSSEVVATSTGVVIDATSTISSLVSECVVPTVVVPVTLSALSLATTCCATSTCDAPVSE